MLTGPVQPATELTVTVVQACGRSPRIVQQSASVVHGVSSSVTRHVSWAAACCMLKATAATINPVKRILTVLGVLRNTVSARVIVATTLSGSG